MSGLNVPMGWKAWVGKGMLTNDGLRQLFESKCRLLFGTKRRPNNSFDKYGFGNYKDPSVEYEFELFSKGFQAGFTCAQQSCVGVPDPTKAKEQATTSEDRQRLEEYIRKSDERVKSWSEAKQEAFKEATEQ